MKDWTVEADVQILTHRVDAIENTMREAINEIRDGIREIAANTGKLAVLEERHAETRGGLERAFDEIRRVQADKCETATLQSLENKVDAIEKRTSKIEQDLPGLKETRTWLITLAGIVIVSVVGALLALVVRGS